MRTLLIALWLALLATGAHAQLFKEWFRQNKTQREYLKEQIVQLKLYLELTKQGYKIAKEGLNTIHQIKNGEFKLHKNRFDSLRIVKSGITSLFRLQHITDLHGSINEVCEKLPAEIAGCRLLDPAQKKRMITGLKMLYDDSQVLIGGFFMVIRDEQVSMTDNERIQRIEGICKEFEENYLLAQNLRRDLRLVCKSVSAELEDIDNRRQLNGIK
ncbi:hypothetical protein ACN9ML_00690 [Dyadobacter endophyticus]|uniref:hypothetical protein n=1 Tax=Dyadobacter TaxID=120831 RepID=UPI003CF55D33